MSVLYLFSVEPAGGVNGEQQGGHVANEEGIKGSPHHHADDGQPGLSDILRGPPTKANA